MATDFTQESLLRFIINNGGTVKNADLLSHYKWFLREDEAREQNRELFKRYVNSVATVRQEEGVSLVVLKKKYRVHLGDVSKSLNTKLAVGDGGKPVAETLPAAGIVTNVNNNSDSAHSAVKPTLPLEGDQSEFSSCAVRVNDICPLKPVLLDSGTHSSGSGCNLEQPRDSIATREYELNSVCTAQQRPSREADGLKSPQCAYYEVCASPVVEKRHLNDFHPKVWLMNPTLGQSHLYKSSPCLVDRPVSSQVHPLSRSNDSLLQPNGGFDGIPVQELYESEMLVDPPTNAEYLQLNRLSGLSSGRDSISVPSPSANSTPPDTGWHQGFGNENQSTNRRYGEGNDTRSCLGQTQEAKLLPQLQSHRNIPSMHHSTGHLFDEDSRASSRSSSPETHRGPIVRRMTSRLRSRMCRSLGEDLDQTYMEDSNSGRNNRLQLLSSTLSMGNLLPSSSRDRLSSPAGSLRSLYNGCKHSSIPLDTKEHDWFVKAASASWTDIYAFFRDDPNLLWKRDFISGFTVIHWIAKHGDHRVLNTLGYGVEKAGRTFDVNAKTLGGYTPLHLATIHGHKKLIRLLVQKYKADVRIRDNSGKRAWQYLSKDENRDILELLGAPQKHVIGSTPLMPLDLAPKPGTTRMNVKRHTSIAALFKHKSHLRVSTGAEAF
ncbi:hypothetical protein DNTS_004642 [Danionella cerebrum]|uniref:SOWAHA-C winged helix-turn-helix domain-containing protein n=1 Tax=Danionella cerebrum TaxID=2873325 RepID=A0A553QYB1_9TELE|nr:hypothetical protein DNTS_004642 [Danionella translucida]